MAIPFTNTTDSATIGAAEYSLVTDSTTPGASTTACELEVWLDLSALAAGDQYRIRLVEKVNGGTAARAIPDAFATGAQDPPIYVIPPRRVAEGWDVRITKIAGTDRAIGWSLRQDVGDVSIGGLGAGSITAATFAAGAIDASAVAADAVTEIQAGLATAAAVAALPSAAAIAAAVWGALSEGAETFGDAVRLIGARLFGKATVQDGDGAYTFRDKADTKNRIAMTRTGTARTTSTRDGT